MRIEEKKRTKKVSHKLHKANTHNVGINDHVEIK